MFGREATDGDDPGQIHVCVGAEEGLRSLRPSGSCTRTRRIALGQYDTRAWAGLFHYLQETTKPRFLELRGKLRTLINAVRSQFRYLRCLLQHPEDHLQAHHSPSSSPAGCRSQLPSDLLGVPTTPVRARAARPAWSRTHRYPARRTSRLPPKTDGMDAPCPAAS